MCLWSRSKSGMFGYPSCERKSITLSTVYLITRCPRCHEPIQWRES